MRAPPKRISITGARIFERCPKQWWFRFISDLPSAEPDQATRFGRVVHAGLAAGWRVLADGGLIEAGDLDALALATERALEALDDASWDEQLDPNLVDEAAEHVTAEFMPEQMRWYHDSKVIAVERRFDGVVGSIDGGVHVGGTIDLALITPSGILVTIDHKTGSAGQGVPSEDRQLLVYAKAVTKLWRDDLPPYVDELVGYSQTGEVGDKRISTGGVDMEIVKRTFAWLREVRDAIKVANESGEYPITPGRHCAWCDYANVCPAGALLEGER